MAAHRGSGPKSVGFDECLTGIASNSLCALGLISAIALDPVQGIPTAGAAK